MKILSALVIFLSTIVLKGQDSFTDSIRFKTAKNTLFVEVLGNGLNWYSINYDRVFLLKKNKISCRIGTDYMPERFTILTEINVLYGKKHRIEQGGGITWVPYKSLLAYRDGIRINNDFNISNSYFVLRLIGYRYQQADGGFFLKTGILFMYPFLRYDYGDFFIPGYYDQRFIPTFIGLAMGYSFKTKKQN